MMSPMQANIGKLYVISALRETLIFGGIMYLFLQSISVTIHQYFLIIGFFSLFLVILEIPSGYLSDRWGRKNTLLLGSIAASIGMFLWATSNGFLQYMIGEFFWAIGFSCYSGTVEAMMYDTLLEQKKENEYRIVTSHKQSINAVVQAAVTLLSGAIAAVMSLRGTYWITLPFTVATIPLVLTLIEPKRHASTESGHFSAIVQITRDTLFHRRALSKVVILSALVMAMTGTLMWSTQPYQTLIDFPVRWFGVPHAVALLIAAVFAQIVPRLEKRVDDRLLILLIVGIVIGVFVALGFVTSLSGLAILLIGRSMIGAITPVSNDLINRMTTSDVRATVLSVQSFANMVFFAIVSPIVGYWADVFTLNQALLYAGMIGGFLALLLFMSMIRVWKEIPS